MFVIVGCSLCLRNLVSRFSSYQQRLSSLNFLLAFEIFSLSQLKFGSHFWLFLEVLVDNSILISALSFFQYLPSLIILSFFWFLRWVVQKGAQKLGYETEAFFVYDVMSLPFLHFAVVMNAWGEAALLLVAGAKGNRSALPSSTIMIKQPIARFQGQATYIEITRKEVNNVKTELVNLLAKHVEKSLEQIEADIRCPKYLVPVIYTERSPEDRGAVTDLKKAQLI
ncbi:hypothetical protein UlMin_006889 [Ulmus minor]